MEFRENRGSLLLRLAVYAGLLVYASFSLKNLYLGDIANPYTFIVMVLGLVFFLIPKLLEKKKGSIVSFGGKNMSQGQRNSYRFGYWLMAVGFLLTFTQ